MILLLLKKLYARENYDYSISVLFRLIFTYYIYRNIDKENNNIPGQVFRLFKTILISDII
jgi:hypothetical protein